MKIQLEAIRPDEGSSFRLLLDSRMNDFYYWHHHPEWELNYIRGADGTRHVGSHVSRYQYDSLVLIGSHIPHLNVDYGVKTDYQKTVLHIQPGFLERVTADVPEMSAMRRRIARSEHGILVEGETKVTIGAMLEGLFSLKPFEQFLEVLRIFQRLAESGETRLMHEAPVRSVFSRKVVERQAMLMHFIETNYGREITVGEAASLCHMTKVAFCRYFKQQTRLTFTEFLNHYRINEAKRLLLTVASVGDVCYACGFESLSYFNRVFRSITGLSPRDYRRQFGG